MYKNRNYFFFPSFFEYNSLGEREEEEEKKKTFFFLLNNTLEKTKEKKTFLYKHIEFSAMQRNGCQ